MALPAEEMRYTFADYLTWDEDDHIELIYGYPYMMSPPLRIHQNARFIQLPLASAFSRRRGTDPRTSTPLWSRTWLWSATPASWTTTAARARPTW